MPNPYRVTGEVNYVDSVAGKYCWGDHDYGTMHFFLEHPNNEGHHSPTWTVEPGNLSLVIPYVDGEAYRTVRNKQVARGGKPRVGSLVIGARLTQAGDDERTWRDWVLGRVTEWNDTPRLPLRVRIIAPDGTETETTSVRCWYPLPLDYLGDPDVDATTFAVGYEFEADAIPAVLPVGTVFTGTVDHADRHVVAPGHYRDGDDPGSPVRAFGYGLNGRFRIAHLPGDLIARGLPEGDDVPGYDKPDDTEDLAEFKRRVYDVAMQYGRENGHEGQIARALEELGVTGPEAHEYEFDTVIRLRVSARRNTTEPIAPDIATYIDDHLAALPHTALRMDDAWAVNNIRLDGVNIENVEPI